jgi:hypothetical protein
MHYLARFYREARTKLTTYTALATTAVAELPDLISSYWGQLEQEVPHLKVYHHAVVVTGILATIWTRVRRSLKDPPSA